MPRLLLLLLSTAAAVREPPDYRAELHRSAAARVEALAQEGRLSEAVEFAERFQETVEPSAAVEYEVALSCRAAGRDREALAHYDRALGLDPAHAAALYDRGEMLLVLDRIEEARRDFREAARLRPDHWAVHFRLAEMAARDRDPAAFEAHLTDALGHGFDFRAVIEDPNWRRWAVDPTLGPVIEKLIVVYSDEKLLDTLRAPQ